MWINLILLTIYAFNERTAFMPHWSTMFLTFFHYYIVVISFKNSNFVRI